MFIKAIAFVAMLGVCYGAEHAYSSQSFVRYDSHNEEHHLPSVKNPAPVHEVTYATQAHKEAVPVVHYVSQGSSQTQVQGQAREYSSHHAVSSQSIQRQDTPAHAPADYKEYHAYPKYGFSYSVEDPHTGDHKSQHESRDGDVVKGVYSLHESDGSIRTVEYSANKHTGFIANVKHSTKHIEPKNHN